MFEKIQQAVKSGNYRITEHADEEMVEDNLKLKEVKISLDNGEVIESYLKDFPFPSYLVYGKNEKEEHIHSVWGYDEKKRLAILITVYRPNPFKWIDFKKRR